MKQMKAFIIVQSAGETSFPMKVQKEKKKRDSFCRIWVSEVSPLPVQYKECFIADSRTAKVKGNSLSTRISLALLLLRHFSIFPLLTEQKCTHD